MKDATMMAARWYGRDDIRVIQLPIPVPAPDQVLVRVLWCGICGTDLEEFREGPLTVPVGQPHRVSGRMAPLTLGHEIVGVVATVAEDGSGPALGAVVVPDVVVWCGSCWWCLRHEYGQCANLSVLGQYDDGGLAEFVVARASTCIVVPDELDPAVAALAEPSAVAVRAVRKVQSPMGLHMAVLGGGTVGQLVARTAMAAGAASTLIVDPVADRRSLGAMHGSVPLTPEEVETTVDELSDPGVDVIFECTGRPDVLAQAIRLVRRGGLVVAVGLRIGLEKIPLADLILGEKQVIGSAAHVWDTDMQDAIRMLADGRLDVGDLITHRFPLDCVVSDGLRVLGDPSSGALKVLIDCSSVEKPVRSAASVPI
jgi:(R,R)-butanediol dehydrogenase / meso-butanediol dehydrogenase / diacetyl reductase